MIEYNSQEYRRMRREVCSKDRSARLVVFATEQNWVDAQRLIDMNNKKIDIYKIMYHKDQQTIAELREENKRLNSLLLEKELHGLVK